ncbi:MAG TPA: phosphodiester glycosidase family protein [Actinomycetota bacterium]|nr:phosphodiester glycosidase family protein [Actinomycetota bacterium]
MKSIRARFAAVVPAIALVIALLMPLAAGQARKPRTRSTEIAPGVTYTVIRDYKPAWRIRVLSVDLRRASTLDVALAQDRLPGLETTSSMAARHGALAALNGDFALPSGRPVHAFAMDGALVQTPQAWSRNFAARADETATYIGHPEHAASFAEFDTGLIHSIELINEQIRRDKQIALYTRFGGSLERPPTFACSARLMDLETPHLNADGTSVEALQQVDAVACSDRRMAKRGGSVLAAGAQSTRAPEIATLLPGEQLRHGWTFGWPGILDSIGGNPTLIEGGLVATANVTGEGGFFARHPRSGIGTTPDGHVLLVAVDGRQPKYSVGMTLQEFADLFVRLGADWALNLDGGGSTAMVVNGTLVNRPSSGYERAVSSALLVLPGADPGETYSSRPPTPSPSVSATPSATPSPSPTALTGAPNLGAGDVRALWDSIRADRGSTGGLLRWLRSLGFRVDHLLRA